MIHRLCPEKESGTPNLRREYNKERQGTHMNFSPHGMTANFSRKWAGFNPAKDSFTNPFKG